MKEENGFDQKKMFGGVGYLLQGNMACGVLNEDLIVRVGPEVYQDALKSPDTRQFDITGRPMKGWVMISAKGYRTDKDLNRWVRRGMDFVRSLPPK